MAKAAEDSVIEKSAIAVSSGSLMLLAIFLILDAVFGGVKSALQSYVDSGAWGFVAGVAALTVAYVLGVMVLTGSDLFVEWLFRTSRTDENNVFALVSATKNEMLVKQFDDVIRYRRVLEGSFVPLLRLAVGSALEAFYPHPTTATINFALLVALAVTSGLLALLCPAYSVGLDKALSRIGEVANEGLSANLSLSIDCERKSLKAEQDLLVIKTVLSKGDRGSIYMHAVQARVFDGEKKHFIDFGDTDRLTFRTDIQRTKKLMRFLRLKDADFRPQNVLRKKIIWDHTSGESPYLRLGPGEKTEMSASCEVSASESCKIEVIVLGYNSVAAPKEVQRQAC